MAITISGENNNDRITAQDGVIDTISGFNIAGIITASSFTGDLTGNVTGNLTGNVNSTSPLLLQTGGSERFRITGNNELGIAGANYGSSGQVLTSGGSGSAVSWTTIPTQVTISNNANDRVITGGSGTNLNGESTLNYGSGHQLIFSGSATPLSGTSLPYSVNIYRDGGSGYGYFDTMTNSSYSTGVRIRTYNNTTYNNVIEHTTSKVTNFQTNGLTRLSITSGGEVLIGTTTDANVKLDVEGSLRAKSAGYVAPASGTGLEIYYATNTLNDTPSGYLISYDRSSSAYKKINYDASEHKFRTSGTERLRITSGGRILGGNHLNDRGAVLQIESSDHAMIGIHRNTADHGAPAMNFSASRGTSAGSNTIVQSGDYLGLIRFSGTDGVNLASGAQITGIVDGTPGENDMPTRLGFWTSADGSQSPTERLRIASNGDIGLGTVPETDSFQPSLYFAGGNANIWGSGNANLYTAVNARYTGGGGWKYNNNGLASYTAQQSGTWEFLNAPSGTADNVATFTTRLRITSTGALQHTPTSGVNYFTGTGEYVFGSASSSPPAGGSEANVQIHASKTRAQFSINAYMSGNAGGPFMQFLSSRSGTVGTLGGKVISNDYLGEIRFSGDNGTNYNSVAHGATIWARAKSTPADGDTVIRGELNFNVGNTDGTPGVKNRLTIQHNGRIKFIEDDVQRNSGAVDNFSGDGAYMQHYVSRNGSTYRRNFDIASVGDGSWGSSIRFSTNPDSNSTTSEAMRINHLRQVKIGGTYTDTSHQLLVDNGSCDFKGRVYVRETLSFYSTPFGANVTYDTGISVNAGGYGGSILAICSRNYGAGTNTQSGLYLIKFHYDGNNTPQIIHIAGTNMATFGQSGSNTLTVAMGPSNNMFTAIESSVG